MPSIDAGKSVKYTAIVQSMEEAIASGRLAEGARLPPHRELAARLGVTVATVTKAIADLARRGLVDTRRGSGTFVVGLAPAEAPPPAASDAPLDLAVNRPLAALAAPFLKDALLALTGAEAGDLFGYEIVGGNAANRATGIAWLAERGIVAGENEVLLTQGGNDGLLAALQAICRPGEAVACEASNYSGIRRLAQALGIVLVPVATDRKGMSPEGLEQACRTQAIKAVLCTPVTHNPTAVSMDLARRAEIAGIVRRRDLVLIEDDIYGHLAGEAGEPFFCDMPERTIHVTSMSKCVSAGLRVGFLAVPRTLVGRVRDALYTTNWTAPSLHAALAARLVAGGAARDLVEAQRAEALVRVARARQIFGPALDLEADRASYHIWLRLPDHLRADEVSAELMRAGILVSPAHHFSIAGTAAPNALRISLGAVADRGLLEQALTEIARRIVGVQMAVGAIA
ncbi:PLP-dependent aminotransferase family protein [Aquabacter spiritensis]|nr:PLP-dependent aminotransferase family protein [Aquabacter spiritensis]